MEPGRALLSPSLGPRGPGAPVVGHREPPTWEDGTRPSGILGSVPRPPAPCSGARAPLKLPVPAPEPSPSPSTVLSAVVTLLSGRRFGGVPPTARSHPRPPRNPLSPPLLSRTPSKAFGTAQARTGISGASIRPSATPQGHLPRLAAPWDLDPQTPRLPDRTPHPLAALPSWLTT